MAGKEILQFFIGTWTVIRIIRFPTNLATMEKVLTPPNKSQIIAIGKAKFAEINMDNISYREDVEVYYDNINMKAYREYKYSYENGKELVKYFKAEGTDTYKLFYKLTFARDYSKAHATYKCGQDLYKATYLLNISGRSSAEYRDAYSTFESSTTSSYSAILHSASSPNIETLGDLEKVSISGSDSFILKYEINGPKKKYIIETKFNKLR